VAKLAAIGEIRPDELVVCVLTGNGLKDPHTAEETARSRILDAAATPEAVIRALGW
jgi:threonine synthase